MTDKPEHSDFADSIRRWSEGDAAAADELLQRLLPWVRAQAHGRLGPALRQKDETHDIVQDAMLEFLRYGQRFCIRDEGEFRMLLAHIVSNVLKDHHVWYTRRRRDMHRESARSSPSSVTLDPPDTVTDPGARAARNESHDLMRLALELLPPLERDIVIQHQFDLESFESIGKRIGMQADAVRKRFHRALPRLSAKVRLLRAGRIAEAAADDQA